jgi:ferredoxin like protein
MTAETTRPAVPPPSVPQVRVEDKLYYNRYLVDAGRAHIKVRPHETPSPELLSLLTACPARCYDMNDRGQVEITIDGCVECGTCRIIGEPTGDIEWNYPRGGYGVLFKFG